MYPVSDKFLEEIDNNSRSYYWTGSITTKDKKVFEFGNEDIVKGSGYITRSCCGSSEIELGSVYAGELGLTLLSQIDRYTLYGAEVKLFFHLVFPDKSEEEIPMGVFEILEASRNRKTIEIKAYDYMLRFDKKLNLESSSGTPYYFLNVITSICKVEMAQTKAEIDSLPNGRETLGIYAENDIETYRDLLFYVAQVLGCVCQINREGRLELLAYGKTPVRTIEAKHRYDSSYSDFVTRYTAILSTNKISEQSEYYALPVDDGLTMNLGVNPLLQFGLKATRKRLLDEILKSISDVEYVPFESSTIGNPALDPLDCLVFRGGEADETKVSCITNITYKINGKHSLKCVGKNPRLSEAKSKNDKNISGLLNQVEENKTVVYDFVNVTPYEIYDKFTEVLLITFVSKDETSAMFLAEMLLDISAYDEKKKLIGTAVYDANSSITENQISKNVEFSYTTKRHPVVEIMYKINDEEVLEFHPTQVLHEGRQIITLFFPLSKVEANSENKFSLWIKVVGGYGKIAETQIRASLSGQGLIAGIGDWNGRIAITDSLKNILIQEEKLKLKGLETKVKATFPMKTTSHLSERFKRIDISALSFGFGLINERVTCEEVVKSFTMNRTYPGLYDAAHIEINGEDAFQLICDYSYQSFSDNIQYGKKQVLEIDTTPFERVESMEVSL